MTVLIRAYQLFVSPILQGLGAQCRYYPSCSDYARRAFEVLPFWRAARKSVRRLLRCHPGCPGGMDPLPLE